MESMSHDPAAGAIGLQLVDVATRGLAAGAAASGPVTALVPAGAEEVSAQAAAAFAADAAAMLAVHTAAQEELARAGVALTDIARMYSQVDGEAAGTLMSAGGQFSGRAFAGGTGTSFGTGLTRAQTVPGAGGSPARTPLMTKLIEGVGATTPTPTTPTPTVPVAGGAASGLPTAGAAVAAVPGAAGAASTAMGAATAPLSSISSIGQGAAAGGAAGPSLASSLTEDEDESASDESAEQQSGERLL